MDAIVLGAGIAGMLAGHVLAKHGVHVRILEADTIAPEPGGARLTGRRGTPQAHHPHNMLHRGTEVLEQLLPGIGEDLRRQGAEVFDFGLFGRVLLPNGWTTPTKTAVNHFAASRTLWEAVIRQRVSALPNVTIVLRTRAVELLWSGHRVVGVTDSRGHQHQADLVVDASGQSSLLTAWLTKAGVRVPSPKQVAAHLSYTSRLFGLTAEYRPDWFLTAEMSYAPRHRHGGVATRIENDQILLTLLGADGEHAPPDEAGFRGYAARLRNPDLLDVIDHAEPRGAIRGYRDLNNRWRRYDRISRWPTGLFTLGDAVCTFNPIYGHGMTVAAIQAHVLHQLIDRSGVARLPGLGSVFQRRLPATIRSAWLIAAMSDVGWYPGHAAFPTIAAHRLVRSIVDQIPTSPELFRRFVAVQNLTAHPATLVLAALPTLRERTRLHTVGQQG